MRITFLAPALDMSGGSRVTHIHARLLAERGHDVTVAVRPRLRRFRSRLRILFEGGGWHPNSETSPTHYSDSHYRLLVLDPFQPIRPQDIPDSDVIVATWWETAEWLLQYPLAKGAKVHFIQHYEAFPGVDIARLDAVLASPICKITISRWLEKLLEEQFAAEHVALVPNSVDLIQFSASPRKRNRSPTIGMLYSRQPLKDTRTGLAAFELVRQRFPDARLLTFGMTPPSAGLRLPSTTSHSVLPAQTDIPRIYAACDVWICSSQSEGFGLPALEAMACRCPIVSTAVGGPLDFVENGVEGFIVPVGDANALASAACEILEFTEDRWAEMSEAAFRKASAYSWNDASALFEAALEWAISYNNR